MIDSASESPAQTRRRAAVIGVSVCVALIAVAIAVPALTGWNVHVRWFPPLHAEWRPRLGPGTPAAIALAVLAVALAPRARNWSWGRLQLIVYLVGVGWMLSLATVDGLDGIGHILDTQFEYLRTARAVTDFGATLREYIAHIPLHSVDNWPVHIAGHPPGALLFFVGLVRIGLGSGLAAGMVVILVAGTTALAVLQTIKVLGAESPARRAAPFLVIGPAAIWMAVSADAMFAAVGAWAACALAVAATSTTTTRRTLWAIASGLLFGYAVMLSYGLPLLGVLAVAILVLARSWRPLLGVSAGAVLVVGAFAVGGFAWWEALPVLQQRYWDGVASNRPAAYWMWGNLAALSISAGPLVGAAVGVAVVDATSRAARESRRHSDTAARARFVVAVLALAGVAMCLLADASQMSRAEVERIWLPFIPWMLAGAALLPERWRRVGLGVQAVFALLVQHLLFTGW